MSRKALIIGESHTRAKLPLANRRVAARRWWRRYLWSSLIVLLAVGGGFAARWLLTAPLFQLDRVETGPYRYTDRGELEAVLTSALGHNIWSADTGALADSLEILAWVREVRIVRKLPSTLVVELQEWQPVLALAPTENGRVGPATTGVVLETGVVLPFPSHLPLPSLPFLVGAELETGPATGWLLAEPRRSEILDLVDAIMFTGLETNHPVDFIVAQESGYVIELQDERGRLLVGDEDFPHRLQRYLKASSKMASGSVYDLRYRNRVGVSAKV
ncbi:MAG: FtsQ-type POTRA domain-containing protein [bacterium]